MRSIRLLALAAAIAAAASCSSSSYNPTTPTCSGTNTNISLCDDFYSPSAVTVTHGATMNWTWKGAHQHNVTFTSGPTIPAGSPTQSTGTFSAKLDSVGTYNFHCTVHGFTGSITAN